MTAPDGLHEEGDAVRLAGKSLVELQAAAEAAGAFHLVPLFEASRARLMAFGILQNGRPAPSSFLTRSKPTLIILGDDHPGALGPAGWLDTPNLLRWAKGVVLHAAAGTRRSGITVAATTGMLGRVLMVECAYRHHAAWLALVTKHAPRLPVLNIVPEPGQTHPVGGAPVGAAIQ